MACHSTVKFQILDMENRGVIDDDASVSGSTQIVEDVYGNRNVYNRESSEELGPKTNNFDRRTERLSLDMEVEEELKAVAPSCDRESSPTVAEAGTLDSFWVPDSATVGDDSLSQEGARKEPSLSLIDAENNEESHELPASRRDNDVPFMEEAHSDVWQFLNASLLSDPIADSLSNNPVRLFDESNDPTVDAGFQERVMPSIGQQSSPQSFVPPSQRVEDIAKFLRDKVPLLPTEHVDGLAHSTASALEKETWKSGLLREVMLKYFKRFYGDKLWPRTMEPIGKWLGIVGDEEKIEGEAGKKGHNLPTTESKKKSKKRYLCGFCRKPKVTYTTDGRMIPHGTCPKHQGTDMGKEAGDNDIDRVLENPPVGYTVKFANVGSDNAWGDEEGEEDQKPAAIENLIDSGRSLKSPIVNRGLEGAVLQDHSVCPMASTESLEQLANMGDSHSEVKTDGDASSPQQTQNRSATGNQQDEIVGEERIGDDTGRDGNEQLYKDVERHGV